MNKYLIILFCLIFSNSFVQAVEVDAPKAVESIHYVVPIEDTQTIETPLEEELNYYSQEIELKGSVIYNEGTPTIPEIELKDIKKPQIKLKTAHTIIHVTEKPKSILSKTTIPMPSRSALSSATRLRGEEYCLTPVWSMIKEEQGNFSYGTEYLSYVDEAQLLTTMNLYTRYDLKHLALTLGVGTNEKRTQGTNDSIVKIAPEIKLSKSFVIRDTVQAYVNNNVKKNKISIIYTPQIKDHIDMLRFELGFSNSFYAGGRTNSAVEFSTRIRL